MRHTDLNFLNQTQAVFFVIPAVALQIPLWSFANKSRSILAEVNKRFLTVFIRYTKKSLILEKTLKDAKFEIGHRYVSRPFRSCSTIWLPQCSPFFPLNFIFETNIPSCRKCLMHECSFSKTNRTNTHFFLRRPWQCKLIVTGERVIMEVILLLGVSGLLV